MPAVRPINRTFENFFGVDRYRSPLSTDRFYARQADNVRMHNEALVLRKGTKPVLNVGMHLNSNPLGMWTTSYEDSAIRSIQERLIAFVSTHTNNDTNSLLRVHEISFNGNTLSVLNNSGATRRLHIYPGAVDQGDWTVDLQDNAGASLTGWPKTYDESLAPSGSNPLTKLVTDLNAVAGMTVSLVNSTADVDGNAGPVGILPIMVAGANGTPEIVPHASNGWQLVSGTTYSLKFYYSNKIAYLEYQHNFADVAPHHAVDYRHPSALDKRGCLYIAHNGYPLLKYDGNRFYRAGMPSNSPGILSSSLGAGSLTGTYNYFVDAVRYDNRNNFIQGKPSDYTELAPATQNATLNIAMPQVGPLVGGSTGVQASATITLDSINVVPEVNDLVYVEQSGVPVVRRVTAVATASSTTKTLTLSSSVSVIGSDNVYMYNENFAVCGAKVNGNQTGTTITVDSGHTLQAGDTAFFVNGETRVLTAVAATTITFADPITVTDNEYISNNVRYRVWRNTNLGVIWYLVAELPVAFNMVTDAYVDSMADATLEVNEQYEDPIKPISQPPNCNFVVNHEGMIATAGDPDNPNDFGWEDIEIIESFPLRNRKTVPSSLPGGITALASENKVLNVFKDKSHFPVLGDLDAGTDDYGPISDGNIGVPSHASLVLISGVVYGCSHRGPIRIQNGTIDLEFGKRLRPDFLNQHYVGIPGASNTSAQSNKVVVRLAQGGLDAANGLYTLLVPKIDTKFSINGGNAHDSWIFAQPDSREYAYDYEADKWFDVVRNPDQIPLQGYAMYNGAQHTFTGTSGLGGFALISHEPDSNTRYDYVDDCNQINMDVYFQHEGTANPEAEKEFQNFIVYSHNDGLFTGFSLRLRGYYNFQTAAGLNLSDATVAFAAASETRKSGDFINQTSDAFQLRITNPNFAERVLLSGYSIRAALPDDEEEMEHLT